MATVPDASVAPAMAAAAARKAKSMFRIAVLGFFAGLEAACAQDIAGIEDCTKTSGLDKRTGCLQSNVNFLHRLVIKNVLDTRQKPNVAVS